MFETAFKYLVNLGKNDAQKIGDRHYTYNNLIPVEEPLVNPLEVNTLSGLVDYIKSNFDTTVDLMVHVESPTEVKVFNSVNADKNRDAYIRANALLPSFNFNNYYSSEDMNIKLQSNFVQNEHRDLVLKVIGNIKEEAVNNIGDDGISQSVTAKVAVATVGTVKVPNPVELAPFRTFLEVDQPESQFVFRLKSGPLCALFEADGGAWKLKAMNNIATYLKEELSEEIEKGSIKLIV